MLTLTNATARELLKDTTAILLSWMWDMFKICLSVLLLMLAGFAAWGAWLNGAVGPAAVGVTAFLLFLACAPWVIPRLPIFRRDHAHG